MKRALLVGLSAVLFVGLSVSPAFTHTAKFRTNVTIRASDRTPRVGSQVTFRVKVSSPKVKCFKHRRVRLIRNSHVIAKGFTNFKGIIKFRKTIRFKGTFWAKVNRKVLTLAHPHEHICKRAVSDKIKVRPHR